MRVLAGRLRGMSREELSWRIRAQVRMHAEEAAAAVRTPQWRRDDIRAVLAVNTLPADVHQAIDAADWRALHQSLWRSLRARPSRFVLNPAAAADLPGRIAERWPAAAADAARRGDVAASGTFDLLGYRGLSFRTSTSRGIDWHFDPVHGRRMPLAFWSRVPYLDPQSGDHKIIWELNRQQHWLTLSRALWLTRDGAHADRMVEELGDWLAANPPLTGGNWASMLELAFRSLSWLWGLHAMLGCPADRESGDRPWLVDLLVALDRHLTHVEHNLSLYFSPNTHLTGEALALYVAGTALPELAASTRWIDTGRRVLLDEIDRQIEPDGGHVERSTHYHRYTLDFYLLALLTARRSGDQQAEERFAGAVGRLAPFALAMADTHGCLPRIGDDDGGSLWPMAGRDSADIRDSLAVAAAVLNRPDWARWGATEEALWLTANDPQAFARALDLRVDDRRVRERRTLPFRADGRHTRPQTHTVLAFPGVERRHDRTERRGMGDRRLARVPDTTRRRSSRVFPQTGYVTSATESGDHLVFDVGPHGYMNGGHAHADALSVVLALRGRPLLVDPGTPTYTMDPVLRDRLRSSSYHNTLTIDGTSSAVPRGPFHWQTRTDARLEDARHNSRFLLAEGRHEGFGSVAHRRVVLASDGGYLFIDEVLGGGLHEAVQYWHFDPQWHVAGESPEALRVVHECGDTAWLLHDRAAVSLVSGDEDSLLGWVSPAYGVRVPAWTASITRNAVAPFHMVTWCGAGGGEHAPRLERVTCDVDSGAPVVAVRVAHEKGECVTMARPGDAPTRSGRRCVIDGFETDARVLQYSAAGGVLASLTVVDATFVRSAGPAGLHLESDSPIVDLHIAWNGTHPDVTTSVEPSRLRLDTRSVVRADFQDHHHVRYRRIR